ncbi:MAG: amidohydrolase family protein, partial [Clostridia bacterium]|nr:amidohydrolase family protein [Clostridia bacterium]
MIRIVNGKIYDPANGKNGEVGELWYNDGRIVEGGGEYETLDAEGCVVMAGGVDIHSHLAGEPLELLRDAANPIIPTVSDIGKQYAGMGYTAVVNAAVPALAARRTILEEQAIDGIDAFNLTWIGENPAFKQLIQNGSDEELDQYLAWLLDVSCGWGLKLINPNSGEEGWREMTLRLIKANQRMGLPHPLHLHHPYLAKPGAYEDIIKTMDMAEGMPLHLAHLQFY